LTPRRIEPRLDCRECKGTGTCQGCDGEGQVDFERYAPPWALERNYERGPCPDCDGDGECRACEQAALEAELYGEQEA
jgi:DnaJ-class molecular chaperone